MLILAGQPDVALIITEDKAHIHKYYYHIFPLYSSNKKNSRVKYLLIKFHHIFFIKFLNTNQLSPIPTSTGHFIVSVVNL